MQLSTQVNEESENTAKIAPQNSFQAIKSSNDNYLSSQVGPLHLYFSTAPHQQPCLSPPVHLRDKML